MSGSRQNNKEAYVFAGGGTAGHVNPALAIAVAVKAKRPSCEIHFAVTPEGLEKTMLKKEPWPTFQITASALPSGFRTFPRFFLRTLRGIREAAAQLKKIRPLAVVGTGGYVCAPLIVAAKLLNIPILLHEQNAYPGRANRLLSRLADCICLSFKGSEKFFPDGVKGRTRLCGNPVKRAFFETNSAEARAELGLDAETELCVVLGGSLGARRLNEAVEALAENSNWQALCSRHPKLLLCLSGGSVNKCFLHGSVDEQARIRVADYLDTRLWMPAADLLIGRAGAGFLMETAASGKASILIPFPQAANDHQRRNAQVFVESGASLLLEDSEVNAESLSRLIAQLMDDEEKRQKMAAAALELACPQAAEDIAAAVLELATRGNKGKEARS